LQQETTQKEQKKSITTLLHFKTKWIKNNPISSNYIVFVINQETCWIFCLITSLDTLYLQLILSSNGNSQTGSYDFDEIDYNLIAIHTH
jgi:hypothetical protein